MRQCKVIFLLVLVVTGCDGAKQLSTAADRVFLNADVYTVNPDQPWAEVVAIVDGRIVFVGSNNDARAYVGSDTQVTDLQGQMLLPGFHDARTHILIGDSTDEECNLLRIDSVAAVEAKLRECTALAGFGEDKWIVGSGWSDWLWPKSEPNKAILDELFPDRPVYLGSSFGHNAWVISCSLELAGIHAESRAGPGGIIVRDTVTGEATGALHDAANQIV